MTVKAIKTELIYGRRPVLETLRGFRYIIEVLGTDSGIKWLRTETKKRAIGFDVPVRNLNKQKLHNLLKHADHQGIAARVSVFEYTKLSIILDRMPAIILLADSITDPHNLGAMIRNAHLCGVGAVIIPRENSADITPVVVHTSAGATEHTPIVSVGSLAHALQMLKERGYNTTAAVKPADSSVSLAEFKPQKHTAVIMGSEGKGISSKILRRCGILLSIPQTGVIDSFNVSVATGIILNKIALELEILD